MKLYAMKVRMYTNMKLGVLRSIQGVGKALSRRQGKDKSRQVKAAINSDDNHKAHTSLVCIENTSNRGGGSCL
jgi:threonine aldolase